MKLTDDVFDAIFRKPVKDDPNIRGRQLVVMALEEDLRDLMLSRERNTGFGYHQVKSIGLDDRDRGIHRVKIMI